MKNSIILVIIILWNMSLPAMDISPRNITMLKLRLITNQMTRGIIVGIPRKGKSDDYFLNPFLFTFIRKTELQDPSLDLLISTEVDKKTIECVNCPLLPGVTSSLSFTYNNTPYTADITTITR